MDLPLHHVAVAVEVKEAKGEVGVLLVAAEREQHVLLEQLLPRAVLADHPPEVPAHMGSPFGNCGYRHCGSA